MTSSSEILSSPYQAKTFLIQSGISASSAKAADDQFVIPTVEIKMVNQRRNSEDSFS